MKTRSVRAGTLLSGAAVALALPAVAMGQLEPVGDAIGRAGQAVQQTLPQVQVPQVPAPVQQLTAPAKPAVPTPANAAPAPGKSAPTAGNQAAAPAAGSSARSGSASSAAAPTTPSSGSVRAAGKPTSRSHKGGAGGGKARAASGNAAGADRVLGQAEADTIAVAGDGGSFTAGAQPSTGTIGDSKLPFTGGYLLLFVALGAGALLTGKMLRTASAARG